MITKKDFIFYSILITWALSGIGTAFILGGDTIWICHLIFIVLFLFLIKAKKVFQKFNDWLESDL